MPFNIKLFKKNWENFAGTLSLENAASWWWGVDGVFRGQRRGQKSHPGSEREDGVSGGLTRPRVAGVHSTTEEGAVRQESPKEGRDTFRPFSGFWIPVSNAQIWCDVGSGETMRSPSLMQKHYIPMNTAQESSRLLMGTCSVIVVL